MSNITWRGVLRASWIPYLTLACGNQSRSNIDVPPPSGRTSGIALGTAAGAASDARARWVAVMAEVKATNTTRGPLPILTVLQGLPRSEVMQTLGEPSWVCTDAGRPSAPCTSAGQAIYSLYLPVGTGGQELVISYDAGGVSASAQIITTRAGLHGLEQGTTNAAATGTPQSLAPLAR